MTKKLQFLISTEGKTHEEIKEALMEMLTRHDAEQIKEEEDK